jgi:hypothetical protein
VAVACANDAALKQQLGKDTDELLHGAKVVLLKYAYMLNLSDINSQG